MSRATTQTLVTPPVTFDVIGVSSKRADDVTDNQWNAYRGMADDNFPEVPPDANITLSFSYPVVLSSLQSALKVASCCKRDDGAGRTVKVLPCGAPYVVLDPFRPAPRDPMSQNSTCAVVQIVPGLEAGQAVQLQLPKGAQYNPVAGRARGMAGVYLWGLRRFRIPLRDNFQQLTNAATPFDYSDTGISYRRMSIWLPHGLAPSVRTADLAGQISLCKYKDPYDWKSPCGGVKFYLDRVDKGKLLMRVPSFGPREHYKLHNRGSKTIKDGFGLPLEPSQAFFFTTEPSPAMQGPQLSAGGASLVLEPAPGTPALQWPIASRGKAKYGTDPTGAASWQVAAKGYPDAVQLTSSYDNNLAPTKLGTPKVAFKRNEGVLPKIDYLPLSGAPGLQLVANTLKASKGISSPTYVSQTFLQYASVFIGKELTSWVTDTRGTPPPAVEGAEVSVYLSVYGKPAIKGPSCTTGSDGSCTVKMDSLLAGRYGSLTSLVEAPGHGLLLVSTMDTPYIPSAADAAADDASKWAGQLVLDRALVKPGDTLHVTGFLQSRNGLRLSLPPASLSSATLTVTPNWNTSAGDLVRLPVTIKPGYGSLHANISVPASAQLVQYEVALLLPSSREGADGVSVATETFQTADPRPPTAVLNLTTPTWAVPNGTVKALIKVTSYLGADVSDATVKITWTVPKASGAINVTTDARGRAVALIPLGELPAANATVLGDTLQVTANWVGPTGDPYTSPKTVTIAEGPVRSTLEASPTTDVPGVPFIVKATTFLDNAAIEGVTVEVTLAPKNSSSLANCSAAERAAIAKQRCVVVSGKPTVGADGGACSLTLPCAADLFLQACAVSYANGTKIKGGFGGRPPCSRTPVGRNTTAWAQGPWSFQPQLSLLKDRENYTLGSTATLSFSVPSYAGPTSGLLIWGNSDARKSKSLPKISPGPNSVTIGPLGDECRGGCRAALVLSVGRNTAKSAPALLPRVPTSRLFDPLSPYTLSDSVSLSILGDNRLGVTVAVEGAEGLRTRQGGYALAAPYGGVKVIVDVRDADGGKPAAGAQVTLVIVDQAILDLMPYDLKDLPSAIQPNDDLYLKIKEINANRASRQAINTTFGMLARRLGLDPWLPLDTTITNSMSWQQGGWGEQSYYPTTNPVDVPDATYLPRFATPVTVTPFYSWGITQRYPASARGKSEGNAQLRLSEDFKTVPVFLAVQADAEGRAVVEFKAPPNLGAFSVRAYAVSKGVADAPSKYGANETKLVVRLPVSLTPALPRMVRVGDVFEAGVLVTAPDAGATPITVSIKAHVTPSSSAAGEEEAAAAAASTPAGEADAAARRRRRLLAEPVVPAGPAASIRLLPEDPYAREATLSGAKQQQEVRFRFSAGAVGAAGLRFDVYLKGSSSAADAAAYDVPVLGRQGEPGTNASAGQAEGLALPEADPGSGSVDLVAGVGNLPFLQSNYDSLVKEASRDPPPDAYAPRAVVTAVLPALLARYQAGAAAGANATAGGWAGNATQLAASKAAVGQLAGELTDPNLGLLYFSPQTPGGPVYKPDDASISLNGWAVWLLAQAAAGGDEGPAFLETLQAPAARWKEAIGRQLIKDAKRVRANPYPNYDPYGTQRKQTDPKPPPARYRDWEDLSWARLALGAGWAPPSGTDAGVVEDLALPRLIAAATSPRNVSIGTAARVGLALLAAPGTPGAKDAVSAISRNLQSQIRVQGRTAYVAIYPDAAFSAWAEDQAWALAFLTQVAPKAGPQATLVQKLSVGVARGPRQAGVGPLCVSSGGQTTGVSAAALAAYDQSRGSTAPDVAVTVTATNAAGAEKTLLGAKFTPANAGRVESTSTPWGALPANASGLSFEAAGRGEVSVAAGLKFTPAQLLPFPTYRGLWVERIIQTEAGEGNLAAAAAGNIVTITVQITTPDDLGQVIVEVLMPGGLEPIDPAVYKDPSQQLQCNLGDGGGSGWYSRWFWCPQTQVTPSLVKINYYNRPAGTSIVSFKATAATPGSFALPPVKAYAVAQPEVMGLSAAGTFVVCPARPPAATTPLVKDPGFGGDDDDARYAAGPGGAAAGGNPAVFGPVPAVCASAAAAVKPPLAAAKACPKDCSGNGVCNLKSGTCICSQGFAGADCSKAKAS